MSPAKFAAITSDILARKGEARPWAEPDKQGPSWPPVETNLLARRPEASQEWKKYVLRITHHDYQRLGILAVKQGKTRQRMLQEMVEQLFGGMGHTYRKSCPCLDDEQCR